MAFKMKPSTYLKTKPNTRSMGMFKQTSTDPPLEANRVDGLGRIVSANSAAAEMTGIVSNDNTTTEVGYTSGRDRQFDETGASIEAGAVQNIRLRIIYILRMVNYTSIKELFFPNFLEWLNHC